eukprot:TRINITY_DN5457_c0_g1_i1.p2 TRINITY_DN5457_c0_g1~~TRINITY_DN5457_c0_g1_i1.p2  ORF type:complete len:119 (-),score=6.71 TRINITY_DN5457_c0_g1_i1:35-391(-)
MFNDPPAPDPPTTVLVELQDGPPPPVYVPEPPAVTNPLEFYGIPPRWLPDTSREECAGCLSEFSVFLRRHHCRACGDIFCDTCTAERIAFPEAYGYIEPERICTYCKPLVEAQTKQQT